MKRAFCRSIALAALVLGMAVESISAVLIVPYNDIDRFQKSSSGDWTHASVPANATLLVGDSSAGQAFEIGVILNIAAYDTQIADASSISFHLAYATKNNGGKDVTLYGFTTTAPTTDSLTAPTFRTLALAGTHLGTLPAGDFSASADVATYDVTSFVKASTGSDYIGLLLTAGPADGDGTTETIASYLTSAMGSQPNGGAYLSIERLIPEPSSVMLFVCGLAALAFARRPKTWGARPR